MLDLGQLMLDTILLAAHIEEARSFTSDDLTE